MEIGEITEPRRSFLHASMLYHLREATRTLMVVLMRNNVATSSNKKDSMVSSNQLDSNKMDLDGDSVFNSTATVF